MASRTLEIFLSKQVINVLLGSPNTIFNKSLEDDAIMRQLMLTPTLLPQIFFVNFSIHQLNIEAKNLLSKQKVLQWFAQLANLIYICRLGSTTTLDTLLGSGVPSFNTIDFAAIQSAIYNLILSIDQELCLMDGILEEKQSAIEKQSLFPIQKPYVSLISIFTKCKSWERLIQSTCQLTCSLLVVLQTIKSYYQTKSSKDIFLHLTFLDKLQMLLSKGHIADTFLLPSECFQSSNHTTNQSMQLNLPVIQRDSLLLFLKSLYIRFLELTVMHIFQKLWSTSSSMIEYNAIVLGIFNHITYCYQSKLQIKQQYFTLFLRQLLFGLDNFDILSKYSNVNNNFNQNKLLNSIPNKSKKTTKQNTQQLASLDIFGRKNELMSLIRNQAEKLRKLDISRNQYYLRAYSHWIIPQNHQIYPYQLSIKAIEDFLQYGRIHNLLYLFYYQKTSNSEGYLENTDETRVSTYGLNGLIEIQKVFSQLVEARMKMNVSTDASLVTVVEQDSEETKGSSKPAKFSHPLLPTLNSLKASLYSSSISSETVENLCQLLAQVLNTFTQNSTSLLIDSNFPTSPVRKSRNQEMISTVETKPQALLTPSLMIPFHHEVQAQFLKPLTVSLYAIHQTTLSILYEQYHIPNHFQCIENIFFGKQSDIYATLAQLVQQLVYASPTSTASTSTLDKKKMSKSTSSLYSLEARQAIMQYYNNLSHSIQVRIEESLIEDVNSPFLQYLHISQNKKKKLHSSKKNIWTTNMYHSVFVPSIPELLAQLDDDLHSFKSPRDAVINEELLFHLLQMIKIEIHYHWPISILITSNLIPSLQSVQSFFLHCYTIKWYLEQWWKVMISRGQSLGQGLSSPHVNKQIIAYFPDFQEIIIKKRFCQQQMIQFLSLINHLLRFYHTIIHEILWKQFTNEYVHKVIPTLFLSPSQLHESSLPSLIEIRYALEETIQSIALMINYLFPLIQQSIASMLKACSELKLAYQQEEEFISLFLYSNQLSKQNKNPTTKQSLLEHHVELTNMKVNLLMTYCLAENTFEDVYRLMQGIIHRVRLTQSQKTRVRNNNPTQQSTSSNPNVASLNLNQSIPTTTSSNLLSLALTKLISPSVFSSEQIKMFEQLLFVLDDH